MALAAVRTTLRTVGLAPRSVVAPVGSDLDWDARDITRLGLWLSGQTLRSVAQSASIAAWPDRSGMGNHPLQTAGGNQPQARHGAINGRTAVNFTSANSQCLLAAALNPAQPVTVIAVVIDSMAATGNVFDGGAGRMLMGHSGGSDLRYYAGGTVKVATGKGTAGAEVLAVVLNGNGSRLLQNGQEVASGSAGTDAISGGTGIGGITTQFWNGDIGELVMYFLPLLQSQLRRAIHNLGRQAGIAVAA